MKKRSFRSTFVSVILVITVAISIVNLAVYGINIKKIRQVEVLKMKTAGERIDDMITISLNNIKGLKQICCTDNYARIGGQNYGSMGAGILSGKIRSVPSFEKNDLRLNFYDVYKEPKFSKIMELLKVMDSIADGHNVPVGQVALNWSTQKEYVGTALVGVRSIEHADENCKTFDWKLTEEEMKILDSKIEECAL